MTKVMGNCVVVSTRMNKLEVIEMTALRIACDGGLPNGTSDHLNHIIKELVAVLRTHQQELDTLHRRIDRECQDGAGA